MNYRAKIATALVSCLLLLIAVSVPAFAADVSAGAGGPSGETGAPPATEPAPVAPVADAVTDPPSEPSTDPVDPVDPSTDPVDPVDPVDPTEPAEPTGSVGPMEPVGPKTDTAVDVVPDAQAPVAAAPATGEGTPPPSGSSELGEAPRSTGTLVENEGAGNSGANAANSAAGENGAVLDVLAGRTAPSGLSLSDGARDTAGRAADQISRNAESGVVAGLVVTRIISEIPSWVFWALGALSIVALAGMGLYLRERFRRRSAEQEAMGDELTGIANRKAFDRRLDLEWRRASRYGRSLGLMVMDLDGFKQVNDVNGHAAGDRVLRDVAQALAVRMRDTDLVARIGGDEFAVICPETGINELMTIRRHLADHVTSGLKENVGLSIGVAEFVPGDEDATSILARADESMYRVKRGEATALPA